MKSSSVERTIYFYRVNAGTESSGKPRKAKLKKGLRQIEALPFTANGRYLGLGDERICCWVDEMTQPPRFRVGKVRLSGLPQLENAGSLTDLAIPVGSGLAENVHVVVFSDSIVGADFNFYGPRMSSVGKYFEQRASSCCSFIKFEPLLRGDAIAQLDKLKEIRMFRLGIRRSYIDTIRKADKDLGAAFDAAARISDAERLEIVLQPEKYSRDSIGKAGRLLRVAKNILKRGDVSSEATVFTLKGLREDTGGIAEVDLLRDQLISHQDIIKQSPEGRALDAQSAYAAIGRAHSELKEELKVAASVSS